MFRSRRVPPPPAIIEIRGLGCTRRRIDARVAATVHPSPYHVLCTPLREVARAFCSRRPPGVTATLQKAVALVRAYVRAGRPVLLFGYGGGVAARVGELLRDEPGVRALLHVATMGATYAPPPPPGLDMVHLMRPGDVRCMRAPQRAFDERGGVFWVRSRPYRAYQDALMQPGILRFRDVVRYWASMP